ncbi:hypothetical protein GNP95_04795 [Paenibacillus woosongensis]|uniref:WG repeat-containing protein n=2 Tax=Paenibacillus woosongensis TaxID=307580 RepID=A0A7X2YYT2_9BACL|nr:hypothetical protein [Paenibacillus woosongensis]
MSGEFVIPPKYYQVKEFSEGLAGTRKKKGGKWGYVDSSGKEVIKYKYQSVWVFENGVAPFENKDKYGYMNKEGNHIWNNVFSTASEFKNGLGLVTYNGEWGYVDGQGNWVYKLKNFNLLH